MKNKNTNRGEHATTPEKEDSAIGLQDDTERVQAAIDAGESLPPGNYRISRPIILPVRKDGD